VNERLDVSGPSHPDHLFTWLDVNLYFAALARQGRWPGWLREIDAYWDGVRVSVAPLTPPDDVWHWLREVLGPLTVEPARGCLLLDDAGEERPLALSIDQDDPPAPGDRRPRWTDRRVVAELANPLPVPTTPLPHDIPIVAFHSFKGGVGRTLHCVAAAQKLASSGQRVLLIDADLEAPGITWMIAESIRIDFAYEDFLALVQGSVDASFTEAISLGRKFLVNQEIDGVVVMPARRDHSRISPPQIEPVDLLTPDRSPYVLSNALARLGHALGADVIMVDLRAGVSELSAPLLLDPRVFRVFVTTISDQSVKGTERVLAELAQRAPARMENDPDCALLLTQFSGQDHGDRLAEVAADLRRAAYAVSSTSQAASTVDADIAIPSMTSEFNPILLNLPASWEAVTGLAERARLAQPLTPLIDSLPRLNPGAPVPAEPEPADLDAIRSRLAAVAGNLVFAETSPEVDFLVTDALRNLAEAHRTEPPIEIVVGGKGAGKTFTYLQLCRRTTWADFAAAAGVDDATLRIPTIPVLASTNLGDQSATAINERRIAEANRLTGGVAAGSQAVREIVEDALSGELTSGGWRRVWLTCFARAIGLDTTPEQVEESLASFARSNSVIFVIDGLEDLFPEFVEDSRQQRALRALLVDCPEWLRTLRGRPLGMVTFVRRDLVQKAIHQNVAQFEKRYEKYALRWNREEALRLAAWVCQRAGALTASADSVRTATADQLSDQMSTVWGDKMGTPKSKEARSDVWFFAALSDFRQQIQARDIVSFLSEAATASTGTDRWSDRILTPVAMRSALPRCSSQKIEAISLENRPVGALLDRLRSLDADRRKLPFTLESVGLTAEQAQLLDANGVVFREADHYWIPEIFRHGLGFDVAGGRRPRVIAVANLVRRRNDILG